MINYSKDGSLEEILLCGQPALFLRSGAERFEERES